MEATGFPPLAEFGGEVNMSAGQWQYVVGNYVNTTLGEEWPGSQIALIEGFAAGAQGGQEGGRAPGVRAGVSAPLSGVLDTPDAGRRASGV